MYRYKGAPAVLPCLAGYPRTILNAYKDWDHYNPYGVLPWDVPGGLVGKEFTCNAGDTGSTPRLGRSPGGGLATYSSILAWETLRTEEPGGLQSMGPQTVRHGWSDGAQANAHEGETSPGFRRPTKRVHIRALLPVIPSVPSWSDSLCIELKVYTNEIQH